MSKVTIGSKFKSKVLTNQFNKRVDLSKVLGKEACVVFFYPKDFTPGCTKEVCSFQVHLDKLNDAGISIYGISSDSIEKHKDFAEKYNITYDLLSDSNGEFRKEVGVSSDLFGLIPGRVSYLIDEKGIVVDMVGSQTKIEKHIDAALSFAKSTNPA